MDDVIFFDGVCNLCNGWARFVLERDGGRFTFAPLQSDAVDEYLDTNGDFDSIVLYRDGTVYTKSTAVLQIVKGMRWPWPLLYALVVVPKSLRDWIYDYVASIRYDWFGKRDECMVPSDEVQNRFL